MLGYSVCLEQRLFVNMADRRAGNLHPHMPYRSVALIVISMVALQGFRNVEQRW